MCYYEPTETILNKEEAMPHSEPEKIDQLSTNRFFVDNKNIYTHMILNYQDPGMHSHTFIEFFYVINGKCNHDLNGKTSPINSGDAFLLTPNDRHTFINLGAPFIHRDIMFKLDYFRSVCAIYSSSLFDNFINGKIKNNIMLTSKQINEIEILAQSIGNNNEEMLQLLTCNICTYIINLFLGNNLNLNMSGRPEWLEQLLSLLSTPENFKTDQNVLVSVFPYSHEHICRTFKTLVGKTITDYFNEQKMRYAHSLLSTSSYSVEQVCEMINFNNISYFYRLFKKYFNTTPRKIAN